MNETFYGLPSKCASMFDNSSEGFISFEECWLDINNVKVPTITYIYENLTKSCSSGNASVLLESCIVNIETS